MNRLSFEAALPMLADAMTDNPLWSIEELAYEAATAPNAAIWRGERSAAFFRINGSVLQMAPSAGDLKELVSRGLPEIEAIGLQNGVREAFIQAGRMGWERVLKPYGYTAEAVILRKRFNGH